MYRVRYRLSLALLRIVAALPQSIVRVLARTSAWFMWQINGRLRRVTECNLAISFPNMPDDERKELARSSLYELGLCILEVARTFLWQLERLDAQVSRVTGLDLLHTAVANGTGTVVLFPHLGNWELAGIILAKHYSPTVMYRPPKTKMFDNFIRQARERRGSKLVPTNSSGVRALFKTLKSRGVIFILPDQVPPRSLGKFAPFFGEETLTMTLATSLIQRTGAKAVCCYCKRQPDGIYELVFREVDDGIYDADCKAAVAGLNKSVERCIMECPEQYQWSYKRYKYLPNLERRDYGTARKHHPRAVTGTESCSERRRDKGAT